MGSVSNRPGRSERKIPVARATGIKKLSTITGFSRTYDSRLTTIDLAIRFKRLHKVSGYHLCRAAFYVVTLYHVHYFAIF